LREICDTQETKRKQLDGPMIARGDDELSYYL